MAKDTTIWIKPSRLASVDMAPKVKFFHDGKWNVTTPVQFREMLYTDAGGWNKLFWQLNDKGHIYISTK